MQIKSFVIASAFILSTLNLTQIVFAQESDALVKALETAAASELNGTVKISEDKPDTDMGDAKIVLRGGGPDTGALFTELMQINMDKGVMSACTTALPVIKLFRDGEKQLNSVTFADKPVSIDTTANAICKAVDFESLIAEVKNADKVDQTKVDGGLQYRVALDADYFEPEVKDDEAGGVAAMQAKMLRESVLDGTLMAATNSSGELQSLTLEVQYNDPMSVIREAIKNGDGKTSLNPADLADNDTPGRKVTITFTVSDDDTSAAKAFASEAAKLLGE